MDWKNKKVLVTGACGTVGSELLNQLLYNYQIGHLVALDNNESELFYLQERLNTFANLQCFLGDVRDRDKLCRKMRGVDIVFHAAAFKHVILCEKSPFEAVQTNIIGVQNIIYAASECAVQKVVFTSSDKAVNPTNVMGTSKLMGERLITAANCNQNDINTVFASTRFGNVLGSRGSVIPIFAEQIRSGGPVTLTDPEMTRFVMSVNDAVRLIIDSVTLARGGEVFVTKMPTVSISTLAEVMIDELAPQHGFTPKDINIEVIGAKPGEKMYEELLLSEEIRRTVELENYFVVLPAFRDLYQQMDYKYPKAKDLSVSKPYLSNQEQPLTKPQVKKYLVDNKLI